MDDLFVEGCQSGNWGEVILTLCILAVVWGLISMVAFEVDDA